MEPVQDRRPGSAAGVVAMSVMVAVAVMAIVLYGGGVGRPLQTSPAHRTSAQLAAASTRGPD
jgi:hypothetical protein